MVLPATRRIKRHGDRWPVRAGGTELANALLFHENLAFSRQKTRAT
jgi:hypothetical protein